MAAAKPSLLGTYLVPMNETYLKQVQATEAALYPADEAASAEGLEFRMRNAADFFFVALNHADELIGYICGTTTKKDALGASIVPSRCLQLACQCCADEDTMSEHDAGGHVLCIHSVVTVESHQRMGIASWMLIEYLQLVFAAHPEVTRVALLAKAHNTALYMRCGFSSHGASPVEHGEDTWYDLQMHVRPEDRALRQFTVDAFASKAFEGNPAAVVVLPGAGALPEAVNADDKRSKAMQQLAVENNLSETAYVQRCAEAPWRWVLRWFTPGTEVTLCGHATLASAAAMWMNKVVPRDQSCIEFATASGTVSVSKSDAGYTLDFPAEPVTACSTETTQEWVQHIKTATGQDDFLALGCHAGNMDAIVHVTPEAFDALPPASAVDFSAVASIPMRGTILTAQGSGDVDFRSRFWGPNAGVNEDPVTGSAHCLLAPFWESQLQKEGKPLRAYQSSTRGGHLLVRHDSGMGRVFISGAAVQTQTSRLSAGIAALFA